ncbi:TerD family protein [Streptomyces solicathayae]|uniref:TerD family protein n=1 Tax=Streptomyces solicathayae TaxID=3081768 RepID=A0ABZ0LPN3_9ACTN|nr:TerD family protein [Streptomyces sp. HUAS YS2]WOX21454.1 TerD family protein [Streptomyces sp. HUAS YS2]
MIKGGNAFVPTVPLRIAVRTGVDVTALLLTEKGRVRGDADTVFHGAPVHPSGAVRLLGEESGTVWLEATLTAIEEGIERVLVVGSTESGAMRDVHGLSVEAFAPDGTSVVWYDVTDAGGETAMVLAELYRRAGGWKFRAVGQGYLNGLAGLAADHGVDVAEEAHAAPMPGAGPVPFQAPAPAPAPFQVPAPPPAQAPFRAPAPAPAAFQPPPPAPAAFRPPPPAFQAPPPAFQAPPPAPPAAFPPPAFQAPPPAPAPAPFQVPAPAPAPLSAPVAAPPVPEAAVPDRSFGAVFEPYTQTGRDNDVITVDGLPPGPVVVELAIRGDGYTGLWPLTRFNKEGDTLVNSTEENFQGRVLTHVPGNGRLRLQLKAEGPWQLRVLPLAAAARLTEEELVGGGPDVLLHTGGTADLVLHYRGDDNLIVNLYELAGHDDPTTLPEDDNVVNEIGKRREAVPLPEGPLIVHLEMADGPWRAQLKRVQPHSGPSTGGLAGVTDIRTAQNRAWWGRR